MILLKSNYDNKQVINFFKSTFSTLESTAPCKWTDSVTFLEAEIALEVKDGNHIVFITNKLLDENNLIDFHPTTEKFIFNNRTEAIKQVLRTLKIIK